MLRLSSVCRSSHSSHVVSLKLYLRFPSFILHPFLSHSPCVPPPSQPQKVERAEEPDVFSPPIRFSHRIAWLHCESCLESDEKQQ